MDSSSIVSFNNDSTFQTTLKGDYNNVSVHEFALHAMRDRCLLLQRRINTLENDNLKLKLNISKSNSSYIPLQEDEKLQLQQQIAELNKQKSQLMHHVFMVSCENKNLWNKISTLKVPDKSSKDVVKQPLVRTSTYIQNAARPSANYQEKYSESSLEEISLKLINSYIQEKSQLVDQYEQMSQLQEMDGDILNVDSIGFTYMEDPALDSLKEIHNQTDKLQLLKKELAQQESDLKLVISKVESVLLEGYKCPTCTANKTKITSTENKGVETSGSLVDLVTSLQSPNLNETSSSLAQINSDCEEKGIIMEPYEKICPMCGQTFKKNVEFSDFQSHVEQHFIGESEIDSFNGDLHNVPNSFDNVK
ncbi:protein spindle-F [Battus philenor]|uniref:protein spindle-F n=1 Tax=Battus philenor TaxID=42288 RepID=UPI0035CFB06C